jgi:hypothetical protein
MELVRSSVSIVSGLPCEKVRSAPAIIVSGPAQRSLVLWPARSRSRLATLSIESSGSFVASAAVSIATGWSEPVPGREFHPLKSSAFHGALSLSSSARPSPPGSCFANHSLPLISQRESSLNPCRPASSLPIAISSSWAWQHPSNRSRDVEYLPSALQVGQADS